MFSSEDKILVKNLWGCERFCARRLEKRIYYREQEKTNTGGLSAKVATTSLIERIAESDRLRPSRTPHNIVFSFYQVVWRYS